jgi:copper chaperone CopZ
MVEASAAESSSRPPASQGDAAMSTTAAQSVVTTYTVNGMTCGHCVGSVTAELTKLPQVTDVAVDLPTGAVTVTSTAALEEPAVAAAVTEAGYELVPSAAGEASGSCCGSCH